MIGQTTPGRRNMHVAYLLLAILAVAALTPVDADPNKTASGVTLLTAHHSRIPGPRPILKP